MLTQDEMVILKLTKIAKEIPEFHTKSPIELQHETNIPENVWYDFINNNEQIRQFIHRRTNEDIEFAHRKALSALGNSAANGNVQAIKELNQLSGILNQNNSKQIVTHYIPRPKGVNQSDEPTANTNTTNTTSTTTTDMPELQRDQSSDTSDRTV